MTSLLKYLLATTSQRHRKTLLGSLVLLVSILGCWTQPVQAEGSRELVENGGHRPYTEWRTNRTGGILRRTLLKVYARAGEVVNIGSSAVGVGTGGNALIFAPGANVDTATPLINCRTQQPGKGFLSTRAQEVAGPLPASGGYDPCVFTPTSDGIYQVVFYGPDGVTGASDPNNTSGTALTSVNTPIITTDQRSTASLWDITVRSSSSSTTEIKGRVFTDYIALIMGANSRFLNSDIYVLTRDGYRYQTRLNGIDPNGFIFFANDQGLLRPDGQPLYRSASAGADNTVTPPLAGGVTIQPPNHVLFFNPPDNAAVIALGVPTTATAPLPPQNFIFTGGTGGSGNQTPVSVGGTFSFDAPQTGNYQIIIDTNNDGSYSPSSGDRVLEGKANAGFNTVTWDGTNGNGTALQPRPANAPYNARIILKAGEYHFPLLDAETNTNGFTIEMLNPPGAFSTGATTTTIYYDERDYTLNGTPVTLSCTTPTNPCDARGGTESVAGGHRFGTNYGDKKAIDTWTYFPSAAVTAPLVITNTNQANVRGTKSVRFLSDADSSNSVTVGDVVQYSITYSNLSPGNSDAISFVISDNLPSYLTFNSAAITSQTSGNAIALRPSYAGSGALTNPGTLRVGDSITITITATINDRNQGNPISNQATATFGTPDNPATTATVFTDADSAGSTTSTPAVNGTFVQVADNGVNRGNNPSSTADDDPTLFTVAVPPVYTVSPAAGRIVINEILYAQTGTGSPGNDEFIELYNASTTTVDLSGWRLADSNLIVNSTDDVGSITGSSSNPAYIFPNGTTLAPGQYAVIWVGDNIANNQAVGATFQTWLGQSPKLNNTGEDIWLYDAALQIVDYVAYGSGSAINTPPPTSLNLWNATHQAALAGAATGQSISLTPNGVDGNTSACWEPATSGQASGRCSGYLSTRDTDNTVTGRITSVGQNNNGVVALPPNLILVKRITAINGVDVVSIIDDPGSTNDNAANWPTPLAAGGVSSYLRGAIDGGMVRSGDFIEYTIYFLSNGGAPVTNVNLCDLVPTNSTFVANSFSTTPQSGIGLAIATTTVTNLTNVPDADGGEYFVPGSVPPVSCSATNTNGAVVVNVVRSPASLPNATAPGTPNSYGFIRFRARVN